MAKQCLRTVCAKRLVQVAAHNPDIVALEADLKDSTQSVYFQETFPSRYIECGIAEQNMVGIAAGLALAGKIPVVHSFACFISMRACEQVRTSVAYPNLNVKFLVSHGGIAAGSAGPTHHAIEDIAIMRSIPGMTVFVPGDGREASFALDAALAHKGPVYIRLNAAEVEDVYSNEDKFVSGQATLLRQGNDACIITTGTMMDYGVRAAEELSLKHKIKARVLQMASVKPIDKNAIQQAVRQTPCLVTVEEHNIIGGLGSAVAEIAAECGGAKLVRLGIRDRFCGVGTYPELLKKEGLTVADITETILKSLDHG